MGQSFDKYLVEQGSIDSSANNSEPMKSVDKEKNQASYLAEEICETNLDKYKKRIIEFSPGQSSINSDLTSKCVSPQEILEEFTNDDIEVQH